jgi:MFS family permease
MGIALGLLWLPSISIVAHWFQRRRILAMGITSSGSSCGGIVFPIMLNRLFHNPSVGFAWGVRAAAFLMLGLLSIATVLMKTRLPNRKEREARGEKSEKPDLKYLMTDSAFLIGSVA